MKAVWKRLACLLLSTAMVFGMAGPAQAAAKSGEIAAAKKAYSKYLANEKINWTKDFGRRGMVAAKDLMFAVVDVNGDKIPELYVYNPKASMSAGPSKLYEYYNGKLRLLNHWGRSELYAYVPSKKVTVDRIMAKGKFGYTYYVTKPGKERTLKFQKLMDVETQAMTYQVGDKVVTKKAYSRAFRKFFGKAPGKLGKLQKKAPAQSGMYRNVKANRKKYLA